MADVKILALVGSLRAASVNRQLAELAAETAPEGVAVTVFDRLGDLPFYNEDIDNDDVPASVVALRDAAAEADAALVVTPEYNGSIPGVLKNAIDWLSRPFGNGALKGKPARRHRRVVRPVRRRVGARRDPQVVRHRGPARRRGPQVVGARSRSLDGKHPRENAEVVAQPARHRRKAGRRSRLTLQPVAEPSEGLHEPVRRLCCYVTVTIRPRRTCRWPVVDRCATVRHAAICDVRHAGSRAARRAYDQGISSMLFRTCGIPSDCRTLGVVFCRPTDPHGSEVGRSPESGGDRSPDTVG